MSKYIIKCVKEIYDVDFDEDYFGKTFGLKANSFEEVLLSFQQCTKISFTFSQLPYFKYSKIYSIH